MPKMGEGHFSLVYVGDGAGHYVKCPVLTTTQRDALTAEEGMIIFNSTTDQLEEYDGATWEAVGQVILDTHAADYGLHTKVVRKTADQTVNNSETLVNATELLQAIGANEEWLILVVPFTNSSANADVDIAVTVPSGCTCEINGVRIAWDGSATVVHTGATSEVNLQGTAADKSNARLWCLVKNGSTAGNFQVQFAQYAAEESDTKMLAGSCLICTQLL